MGGKNPSPADELCKPTESASSAAKIPVQQNWDEDRISSASELFEMLNQAPMIQSQTEIHRELTQSEFLELLSKQAPKGQFLNARSVTADGSSQGSSYKTQIMHKDRNQDYQSVAIDQCDITSSVNYGSRDYYRTSTHTSDTSYIQKENELDELYKTCTDIRGNWWKGSFYY